MGPLFHLQTLENFFIRLSLPKTQWSHCCGKNWTEHSCNDTSTSEPYITPRTGFSRSHFILYIRILFVCLFVLPMHRKDAFSMKLWRFVGSSLVHMDFTMTVIVFIYFKEKLWDLHCAEICGVWEKQFPGLASSSSSARKPRSHDVPKLDAEIPYDDSSPTLHFEEAQLVRKAALEMCTLTMSQVNCQETK